MYRETFEEMGISKEREKEIGRVIGKKESMLSDEVEIISELMDEFEEEELACALIKYGYVTGKHDAWLRVGVKMDILP